MKKKCCNCGSADLEKIQLEDLTHFGMDTYLFLNGEIYVCKDCDHIEFFLSSKIK